jgi:hypothetical protein
MQNRQLDFRYIACIKYSTHESHYQAFRTLQHDDIFAGWYCDICIRKPHEFHRETPSKLLWFTCDFDWKSICDEYASFKDYLQVTSYCGRQLYKWYLAQVKTLKVASAGSFLWLSKASLASLEQELDVVPCSTILRIVAHDLPKSYCDSLETPKFHISKYKSKHIESRSLHSQLTQTLTRFRHRWNCPKPPQRRNRRHCRTWSNNLTCKKKLHFNKLHKSRA